MGGCGKHQQCLVKLATPLAIVDHIFEAVYALTEPVPRPCAQHPLPLIAAALGGAAFLGAAMGQPHLTARPGTLLLTLLALSLFLAPLAEGLRAESAALKRGRKKKRTSDARLLNETGRSGADRVQEVLQRYIDNSELTDRLKDLEKRCKGIARLVEIGKSVKGRCGAAAPTCGSRRRKQQIRRFGALILQLQKTGCHRNGVHVLPSCVLLPFLP